MTLQFCSFATQHLLSFGNFLGMIVFIGITFVRLIVESTDSDFYQDVGKFSPPFLLFLLILGDLKWGVSKVEDREKRARINMMIGSGGISIGAIASKLLIFMDYPGINVYSIILFITVAGLFHGVFSLPEIENTSSDRCYNNSNLTKWGYRVLLILNIITLVVSMRIASSRITDRSKMEETVKLDIWFSVLMAASMMDFFGIAVNFWQGEDLEGPVQQAPEGQRVQETNVTALRDPAAVATGLRARRSTQNASQNTESIVTQYTPDCKICTFAYTTSTRTPRILPECFHTICQECAGKLLAQNLGRIVICPYCQTTTAVNGPVEKLPKNFALLEVMDNLKS